MSVEPSNADLLEGAKIAPTAGPEAPQLPLESEASAARAMRAADAVAAREFLLDTAMLSLAIFVSTVSGSAVGLPPPKPWMLAAFSVLTLALLAYNGLYRHRFAPHFLDDLRTIVGATAVAAISVTFIRVLVADDPHAASDAVRIWLFSAAYLAAARGGVQLVNDYRKRHRIAGEPTLILGAGRVGRLVAQRLDERPEFGLTPVAFFDHDPLEGDDPILPVIGRGSPSAANPVIFAEQLESAVRGFSIQHVIVTFSLSSHEVELALVRRCQDLGVSVSLVPRLFEGIPDQTMLERIGGLPLVSLHPTDPKGWQFGVKYALDRIFALAAILLTAPVMLLAALGTWLTSGRPILFRQLRIGMDGHEFEILKFRTMRSPRVNAPSPGELEVSIEQAPGGVEGEDRRTAFGAILRRTSIDELPQLFNVLRGDMSVIGPRPERPEFAWIFDRRVHRYLDRRRVKSGITGWAQIQLPRVRGSLTDRAEWDNYYIENWSLWLDFKITLLTVAALFRHRPE